uniref:MMS1_N domain-containing protein n=1 Tax=Meloidogyne hapla TaxID=6305 RepID=A0A1I8BZ27_MELHA
MFEPTSEFPVKTGAAFLSNNLSVYNHKTKGQTYVAYLGKDAVQILSWNEKMEQDCCELLSQEEIGKSAGEAGEKPISLMQICGCNSGEIIQIACNSENTFQIKKNLKEHNSPITDIASCSFDLITVSGDVGEDLTFFSQSLSVINVLRKQVFCGNLLGQISVYSATNGALLAEVNAHSRQITALAVATESAYIVCT